MRSRIVIGVLAVLLALGLVAPAQAQADAGRHHAPAAVVEHQRAVLVTGDVADSGPVSAAQLAAMAQTTLTDHRPGRDGAQLTGVLLGALVAAAGPVLPAGKNAGLRVLITVSGRGRPVLIAAGELGPSFGDHPALLALSRNGRALAAPELVFPDDTDRARTVAGVDRVDVRVPPVVTPTLPAGSVQVSLGRRTVTLSAAQVGRLPASTRTVVFLAGSGSQQHVESGPALADVVRLAERSAVRAGHRRGRGGQYGCPAGAHRRRAAATAVTAIGQDGYAAAVGLGEAADGGRPLLLSLREDSVALAQPRLVPDGDVKGGRYVSGVVALRVSSAAR